jgi:hypothetical protein
VTEVATERVIVVVSVVMILVATKVVTVAATVAVFVAVKGIVKVVVFKVFYGIPLVSFSPLPFFSLSSPICFSFFLRLRS